MNPPAALEHRSARRFDSILREHGLTGRVVELPASTRTAVEAAQAVGAELRQIVKSLVFEVRPSGEPVLLLVSGRNRADEEWVGRFVGGPLARADPERVRGVAGFAIGGVPPVGHSTPLRTWIDYDLLELPEVWAAAGHPSAVCRLSSLELLRLTRGTPIPVGPSAVPPAKERWVTFDCYGTLVDWRAGLESALTGGSADRRPSGSLLGAYLREEPAVEAGVYRRYREIMAETAERAFRSEGIPVGPELAATIPASVPSWPAFPDAAPCLDALRAQGIRVGILSNIDRDLLQATLTRHGLHADRVVTAEDVQCYKPGPPHWARFLKETGIRPERVLHVSASYSYDLSTASLLGMGTGYVSRYEPLSPNLHVGQTFPDLATLAQTADRLLGLPESGAPSP